MSDTMCAPGNSAASNPNPSVSLGSGNWVTFTTAVRFLTRLPLGGKVLPSPAALQRCPIYFPLVGTLLGLGVVAAIGINGLLWPVWLAVLLALAAEIWLTGALHEDGLADFCDAFGGGWTQEDVLRILKDSRLGTFGVLGLGIAVSLRYGTTVAIIEQQGFAAWTHWGSAVIASSAMGRWMIVLARVLVPPVPNRESLACGIGQKLSLRNLASATLWALPAAGWFAVLMPAHFCLAIVLLLPMAWWFFRTVHRRLGGITGDCLGCLGFLTQNIVLVAAAATFNG